MRVDTETHRSEVYSVSYIGLHDGEVSSRWMELRNQYSVQRYRIAIDTQGDVTSFVVLCCCVECVAKQKESA